MWLTLWTCSQAPACRYVCQLPDSAKLLSRREGGASLCCALLSAGVTATWHGYVGTSGLFRSTRGRRSASSNKHLAGSRLCTPALPLDSVLPTVKEEQIMVCTLTVCAQWVRCPWRARRQHLASHVRCGRQAAGGTPAQLAAD